MKTKTLVLASTGAVWILTVSAAYYLGKNNGPSAPASRSSGVLHPSVAGQETVADAAEKPLPVRHILAGIKEKMRLGGGLQNPAALMSVMGLLDKIRPEDIPEALAEIEQLTDPRQKASLLMALLGKWAAVDGPAAMEYTEKHASEAGAIASINRALVAGAWAERDPEAIWEWYQRKGQTGTDGKPVDPVVVAAIFSGMAAGDPAKAFSRLQDFEGTTRAMALAGIFQSAIFDPEKRQTLLRLVDTMPDDVERAQARRTMVSQWTMMAPEEAMAWVKEQPAKDQGPLRESAGNMLQMSDPKKGAAFILEGATPEELPGRYGTVVLQWAVRDVNAAGTWLREQPQGPQLDEARRTFVSVASERDPASAMVWAGTITDPVSRVSSMATAWQAWKKTDPAAADNALAAADLTDEQRNTVRNAAALIGGHPAPPVQDKPVTAPDRKAPEQKLPSQ